MATATHRLKSAGRKGAASRIGSATSKRSGGRRAAATRTRTKSSASTMKRRVVAKKRARPTAPNRR